LLSVSVQTCTPVVHRYAPSLQGFVTVQAVPVPQTSHAPVWQTMFVPQTMPLACAVPVSMHDSTPVAEQTVCPT
jgi:hypothetical protein